MNESRSAHMQENESMVDHEIDPKQRIKRFLSRESSEKRLIVILENAALETVKVGNTFQLLNCDRHQNILKKYNRDLNSARPDIVHQSLMMLLDSPLNQNGFLQIFIRTQRNILIEVNPQTRIPRTYDRFCGLMVQLLHKLSVKAAGSNHKLLKVIKNPITDHLPPTAKRIVMSHKAEKIMNISDLIPNIEPIVLIVGCMAHGSLNVDYASECVSINSHPLSAALIFVLLFLMSIGIPIKILHEAEGHTVTAETDTGEVFRGKLIAAEDNMNCQLTNVTVTAKNGKVSHVEQIYIRGSKIKFFILPDMLKNAPMFKRMVPQKSNQIGRGKSAILKAQVAAKVRGADFKEKLALALSNTK